MYVVVVVMTKERGVYIGVYLGAPLVVKMYLVIIL